MFGFTYLRLASCLKMLEAEARSGLATADGGGSAEPGVDPAAGPLFPRPTRPSSGEIGAFGAAFRWNPSWISVDMLLMAVEAFKVHRVGATRVFERLKQT